MIEAGENTISVVPTFGVTTGNYEFPQPLHDALDKFQADTGIDIMHIDAASGGLRHRSLPDIVWDTPAACEIDVLQAINSVLLHYGLRLGYLA